MLLCIPIILLLTMAMVVTFSITWKTGRLKEVRSDLMVLSFVVGILSQLAANMVVLGNVLIAVGTVSATLGLTNPWFRRKRYVRPNPVEPSSTVGSAIGPSSVSA